MVRYLGQMRCIGYEVIANRPDRQNNRRKAIVFKLERA
jgi:hypothetical protein